ncbi:MAG: DUF302 domain-containing protein [Acidobacteria bacterium]|nr:DUF302 domain-containing protein [Acidobacteriota bacterium]
MAKALEESAAAHKFGVLTVHDLQQTLQKKGVEMDREVRIFEVCNPHQAKRALDADPRVSTALPCRISVYASEGGLTLATILPTELMKGFESEEMAQTAREVEDVIVKMMGEAAG